MRNTVIEKFMKQALKKKPKKKKKSFELIQHKKHLSSKLNKKKIAEKK